MSYYIKANHVSGQIFISGVDDVLGYESIRATIALNCDTAVTVLAQNNLVAIIADNGVTYHLYSPITRVFNNGTEEVLEDVIALGAWVSGHKSSACSAGGGGGGDLVSDLTPQLGGDLDLNSYEITSPADVKITLGDDTATLFQVKENSGVVVFQTGNIESQIHTFVNSMLSVSGDIGLTGTVDGRNVALDGANLDSLLNAFSLQAGTITALEDEANWGYDNVYGGPTLQSVDLVSGKRHVHSTDPNVLFECLPGSPNYWVRTSGRDRSILTYKLGTELDAHSDGPTTAIITVYADLNLEIKEVRGGAVTAPSGGALVMDVHHNGTSIFSTTKLVVADGTNTGSQSGLSITSISQGDKLEFLVDTSSSATGAYISLLSHIK